METTGRSRSAERPHNKSLNQYLSSDKGAKSLFLSFGGSEALFEGA